MSGIPEWVLDPRFVWFVIGVILFLAEFALPGLIIFFFGLGAWVVSLICFVLDIGLTVQLLIFLVSSVLFLVLLRHKFKVLFKMDDAVHGASADAFEDWRGKRVVVTEDIELDIPGRVEYNGTNWAAVSDVPVEKGRTVEIVDKNNITFKVVPLA